MTKLPKRDVDRLVEMGVLTFDDTYHGISQTDQGYTDFHDPTPPEWTKLTMPVYGKHYWQDLANHIAMTQAAKLDRVFKESRTK